MKTKTKTNKPSKRERAQRERRKREAAQEGKRIARNARMDFERLVLDKATAPQGDGIWADGYRAAIDRVRQQLGL